MENFSVCHSDARPEVKGEKTLVLFFSMKKCSDQNDPLATLMLDQPYILKDSSFCQTKPRTKHPPYFPGSFSKWIYNKSSFLVALCGYDVCKEFWQTLNAQLALPDSHYVDFQCFK